MGRDGVTAPHTRTPSDVVNCEQDGRVSDTGRGNERERIRMHVRGRQGQADSQTQGDSIVLSHTATVLWLFTTPFLIVKIWSLVAFLPSWFFLLSFRTAAAR